MSARDHENIIGGVLMAGIGLATVWLAHDYRAGTLVRMGPGYFPMVLGWLLTGIGMAIFFPALRRSGKLPSIHLRSFALILLAVVIFAATVERLGLIAASFATALVASFAEYESTLAGRLLLAASVTAITIVIFSFGLGMSIPLIPRNIW
ncbi:MAG: tripartite tricarboxylate transporter TctB family protein [Rhodobacteraceae bacterium]|nr:MAG: tripartite tricarboxylate transporter TctB family protein [Paracoccaceae bacterium]